MANIKTINGTFGAVWVNGEKLANVKSFECKATLEFEDVAVCESLGTIPKYKGYSIEGTMTLNKVDSKIAALISDAILSGSMPEIILTSKLADPAAAEYENVEIDGVAITELTIMKFEAGSVVEEEVPFKAETFKYLDKIS